MSIPEMDWTPLWLTMQLAGVTVLVLLIVLGLMCAFGAFASV